MNFGVRDVYDIVLKDIKTKKPIFYFSSLKATEMSNNSTTVFAKGGHGNPSLISWTGSREVKLQCEEALISPESFALFVGTKPEKYKKIVHLKEALEVKTVDSKLVVELNNGSQGYIVDAKHPMYVFVSEENGNSIIKELTKTTATGTVSEGTYEPSNYVPEVTGGSATPAVPARITLNSNDVSEGDIVIVDYYIEKLVSDINITSDDFPGAYFIEGTCLWRDEDDQDHKSRITIPKGKIIGNFTMNNKPEGDPSTFKFEIHCMKPKRDNKMLNMTIEDDIFAGGIL